MAEKNKESIYSILYTLLVQHQDAESAYRDASKVAKDDDLAAFLSSLSEYRGKLYNEVRNMLEQFSPVPVRNKGKEPLKSFFSKEIDKVEKALANGNRSQVIEIAHLTEKEISDYYKKSLEEQTIPEGMYEILNDHHRKVLEISRKTERMNTVPQLRNNEI